MDIRAARYQKRVPEIRVIRRGPVVSGSHGDPACLPDTVAVLLIHNKYNAERVVDVLRRDHNHRLFSHPLPPPSFFTADFSAVRFSTVNFSAVRFSTVDFSAVNISTAKTPASTRKPGAPAGTPVSFLPCKPLKQRPFIWRSPPSGPLIRQRSHHLIL